MTEPRILAVGEEPEPMDDPRPERHALQRNKPKGKRASSGRFQSINSFIDVTMARLTPAERGVWLVLWRDTKPDGLARTSQVDMARRSGISDRAVRSLLIISSPRVVLLR